MRPLLIATALGALTIGAASLARAADTPRQTYDHAVYCTSHVLALQAGAARQDAKGAAEAPNLDEMVKRMRNEAVAAGAAVSVPADRVSLQIDEGRDRLVKELTQPDPGKAKHARQEIGMTSLSCVFDEAGKAIAARTAERAASAAK